MGNEELQDKSKRSIADANKTAKINHCITLTIAIVAVIIAICVNSGILTGVAIFFLIMAIASFFVTYEKLKH